MLGLSRRTTFIRLDHISGHQQPSCGSLEWGQHRMLDEAPQVQVCLLASPPCLLPKGTLWKVHGLFSHVYTALCMAAPEGWL